MGYNNLLDLTKFYLPSIDQKLQRSNALPTAALAPHSVNALLTSCWSSDLRRVSLDDFNHNAKLSFTEK